MAVVETTPHIAEPDGAPLWLPRHDSIAVDQAAARPADWVDGYSWLSRLATTIFGSRWKTATRVATGIAVLAFFVLLPTLSGAGWGGLIKSTIYQSWTLAIVLALTWRVRSVSIQTVAVFWLAGLLTTTLFVHFVSGPLASLSGTGDRAAVWVFPILEALLTALPLVMAVVLGKRFWRHPGLCDLMILGFAVGGGFAFGTDGLWERTTASGLKANLGFLIPSIAQGDNGLYVGHAVWTALVGLAIGLLLLHRHKPLPFVAAIVILLMVVGDRMAVNDGEGTLRWIADITLGSNLLVLVAIGGMVAAVRLDERRLNDTAIRDYLFPTPRHYFTWKSTDEADIYATLLTGRYRRRRNGVHTTVNGSTTHWPPMSSDDTAPIAELARLASAADVAAGPGSSPVAWAPEPDAAEDSRFVGLDGWTAYLVTADGPETSTPRARPEASAQEKVEHQEDFWQMVGLAGLGFLILSAIFIMITGDTSPPGLGMAEIGSLADAPNSPWLIPTAIGGVAAALGICGLGPTNFGAGTEVGPVHASTAVRSHNSEA